MLHMEEVERLERAVADGAVTVARVQSLERQLVRDSSDKFKTSAEVIEKVQPQANLQVPEAQQHRRSVLGAFSA